MGQISFLVYAFVSALICLKCYQIIIEAQAVFTLIKLKQWEYVIIDVMQQSLLLESIPLQSTPTWWGRG